MEISGPCCAPNLFRRAYISKAFAANEEFAGLVELYIR
jgi:hypothetical protein